MPIHRGGVGTSDGGRVELYRPQIEGYRRVLAHMLGIAPSDVGAKLLFLELGVVRDVD